MDVGSPLNDEVYEMMNGVFMAHDDSATYLPEDLDMSYAFGETIRPADCVFSDFEIDDDFNFTFPEEKQSKSSQPASAGAAAADDDDHDDVLDHQKNGQNIAELNACLIGLTLADEDPTEKERLLEVLKEFKSLCVGDDHHNSYNSGSAHDEVDPTALDHWLYNSGTVEVYGSSSEAAGSRTPDSSHRRGKGHREGRRSAPSPIIRRRDDHHRSRSKSPRTRYPQGERYSSSRGRRERPSGRSLHVGRLSFYTTEEELANKFSEFGRVTNATLIRDKRSGNSRGYGFVTFEREEDANEAMERADDTVWNGRRISVSRALKELVG